MTTQEFIENESMALWLGSNNPVTPTDLISLGLTKGLEIAKEFAEWTQRNRYKQKGGKKGKGEWYVQSAGYGGGEPEIYTTSELLTIFLTEKYGK